MTEASHVFLCPRCKRTASIPDSFRYALHCPYCNSEMKEIACDD